MAHKHFKQGRAAIACAARLVARSMGVGAVATAVDLTTLWLLVSVKGLSPRLASAPALGLGIGTQFVGNKLVAFRDRSPAWVRQGMQFLAVELCGLAANLWLYDLAVAHIRAPYLLLRLGTTNLVYFGLCLPLWSRIFAGQPIEKRAPDGHHETSGQVAWMRSDRHYETFGRWRGEERADEGFPVRPVVHGLSVPTERGRRAAPIWEPAQTVPDGTKPHDVAPAAATAPATPSPATAEVAAAPPVERGCTRDEDCAVAWLDSTCCDGCGKIPGTRAWYAEAA